ncbi:MAG: sortase [Caldilineaceae bacterium]
MSVYSKENQVGGLWFENWNTAAYAAGYHEGSALLGQAGNTVISGHNNIDGAVFQNLYQIQPGARSTSTPRAIATTTWWKTPSSFTKWAHRLNNGCRSATGSTPPSTNV